MVKELPEIHSFLKQLEQLFDGSASGGLQPETIFRNLPGWTSLQSLVVIVNLDEEYGVSISADELQQAQTLADLYRLAKEKQGV